MKPAICILLLLATTVSCKKNNNTIPVNEQPVTMKYTDLADTAIRMFHTAVFDLNKDGEMDIYFGTQLVGDPLSQSDKWQWLAVSSFNCNLPVSAAETIPVLNNGDLVPAGNFSGYSWYNASAICLLQKVVTMTMPPFWEGDWKNASHKYIPLQVNKNGSLYNGWVEVSFNTAAEKLVLHKAAVCEEAGKAVRAGK